MEALVTWPGSVAAVPEGLDRVCAVAQAYKHYTLTRQKWPLTSYSQVVTVAKAYGVGNYGAGKFGPPEVLIHDKTGQTSALLGDVPPVLRGWFHFLANHGAGLPPGPIIVLNVLVYP